MYSLCINQYLTLLELHIVGSFEAHDRGHDDIPLPSSKKLYGTEAPETMISTWHGIIPRFDSNGHAQINGSKIRI